MVAGAGLGLLVVPLVNVLLAADAGGAPAVFSTAGGTVGVAVIGNVFFDHSAGLPFAQRVGAVAAALRAAPVSL